ncbi:T9SS type A sorting domain-containing protein [candidate division WOR-3 bacterium]|nr:T9SS type A sorting domain-containing protein [candidate division WOR-3 bacterium]
MKYVMLIAVSFVFTSLSAGTGPSGFHTSPAYVTNLPEMTDSDEAGLLETTPYQALTPQEEINTGSEPSAFAPLWGPDLLVTDQCQINSRYNIAMDFDANAYIYAAIQSSHDGGTDTLFIFRSTDNGYSWNMIHWDCVGSGGKLLDFDMRLEPYTTDDPEIYIIWADSEVNVGYRLFFGAIRPSGIARWFDFSNSEFDSTFQVAMDVSPDSNPFIVFSYISYTSTAGETSWQTAVSADTGLSWTNTVHNSTSGPMEITASCLDANHYYVGTIYTQSSNRFRSGCYNGSWTHDNISTSVDIVRFTPSICTQKYSSYPSNYVYALYTEGADPRINYNYSSDGGSSWTGPSQWSISGDVTSSLPNIRIGWNQTSDRPVACCNVAGGTFDTLVCAMVESNLQTWYLRAAVNDYPLTGSMPAQITYALVAPINGRIVIYREYGENNIWFDRWNYMNQVEETPDILPDMTSFSISQSFGKINVRFSTPTDQHVRIEVYDILGRRINTLADRIFSAGEHSLEWNTTGINGEKVVAGTYFINLISEDFKQTSSIQLF